MKMEQDWNYYRAISGERVINDREEPVSVIKHDGTGLWVVEKSNSGLVVRRYDRAGRSVTDGRLVRIAKSKRYSVPIRRVGYVVGKLKDGMEFRLGHAPSGTEGVHYYGYWWHDNVR